MERVKELAESYAEPWRSALSHIADDAVLPVDCGQYWMPVPWDNRAGRVTLTGDAFHPMLPHRGQGLNNAVQDAAQLVETFKKAKNGELGFGRCDRRV